MEEEILPATNINPPNMLPADSAVSAASTGAADVYSAANIAAAISTPMKMPNLKDPMKLRTDIQNALGIPGIQQNVNNLLAQINDATKQAAAQNTYLGNQPVAMPVITGQQAHANRLNTDKINALTGNLNVQNAYLGQLQNEASARTAIALNEKAYIDELRMANPAAGIKYGDSRTKIAQKIRKANYKNALRVETRALYREVFGTTPQKGMSVREQQVALKNAGVESRQLDLAQKRATVEATKALAVQRLKDEGKTKENPGGYTDQELRKLRNAKIDPYNIEQADDFLYGSGLTKQEKTQLKYEEATVGAVKSMVKEDVPTYMIKKAVEDLGFNFDELIGAYKLEGTVPGYKEGTKDYPKGFAGSGQGFWANFWEGIGMKK